MTTVVLDAKRAKKLCACLKGRGVRFVEVGGKEYVVWVVHEMFHVQSREEYIKYSRLGITNVTLKRGRAVVSIDGKANGDKLSVEYSAVIDAVIETVPSGAKTLPTDFSPKRVLKRPTSVQVVFSKSELRNSNYNVAKRSRGHESYLEQKKRFFFWETDTDTSSNEDNNET